MKPRPAVKKRELLRIASFPRNDGGKVVFSLMVTDAREKRGLLDIRLWEAPDDGSGQELATRDGFIFEIGQLSQFKQALTRVEEALAARGLIEKEVCHEL
jgi:hypothetical protein